MQPPLHVVNALLEVYEEAARLPGRYGFLPLHLACGTGASVEVISRLIQAYPAATRCRDDLEDSLPLHLAAQCGAKEEVLMEVLTHHPQGSLLRDATGKTALDHALALPESEAKQYLVTSLETAPILVATAKAATQRGDMELQSKLQGIQQAHNEFIRQLEERHEEEQTEFLQMEIGFHNALALEKERNCELAEAILDLQRSDVRRKEKTKGLHKQLEEERQSFHTQLEEQRQDIQTALDAGRELAQTTSSTSKEQPTTTPKEATSEKTLFDQVSSLATGHQELTVKLQKCQQDLKYNSDMVHHLNTLLSSKDQEILKLQAQLQETQAKYQTNQSQLTKSRDQHNETQQDLNSTRNEMNRLQRKSQQQGQQLLESSKKLQVQESRMGNIASLVESLSYNVETWKTLDEAKEFGGILNTSTPNKTKASLEQDWELDQDSKPTAATVETVVVQEASTGSKTKLGGNGNRTSPHIPRHIQGIARIRKQHSGASGASPDRTQGGNAGSQSYPGGEHGEYNINKNNSNHGGIPVVVTEGGDQTVGLEVRVVTKPPTQKRSSSDKSTGGTDSTALSTRLPDGDEDDTVQVVEDDEEGPADDGDMSTLSQLSSATRGLMMMHTILPIDN